MGMLPTGQPDYDGFRNSEDADVKRTQIRTVQAFKDQCDVNKILKKAAVKGGISHVQKYPEAVYGEFDGQFDLLTAHERISKANEIFGELPAEVRREFNNNALEFVNYAAKLPPGELLQKIPAIARPGDHFPNPVNLGGQGAGAATATVSPSDAQTPPTPDQGTTPPPASPSADSTPSADG